VEGEQNLLLISSRWNSFHCSASSYSQTGAATCSPPRDI